MKMPGPTRRRGSAMWQFKKRPPADILNRIDGVELRFTLPAEGTLPPLAVKCRMREIVEFSLATPDLAVAKRRYRVADGEFDAFCNLIRNGAVLYDEETKKIATELFQDYAFEFDKNNEIGYSEDPFSDEGLRQASVFKRDALILKPMRARFNSEKDWIAAIEAGGEDYDLKIEHFRTFGDDDRTVQAMESRYGVLCTWMMKTKAIDPTSVNRYQLLYEFERLIIKARVDLALRESHKALNSISQSAKVIVPFVSLNEIFERWRLETNPAKNTIKSWRGVIGSFIKYVGHQNAAAIEPDDIVRWKDHLIGSGTVSRQTISNMHYPAIRRMYSYAINNRILMYNPAERLKLSMKNVATKKRDAYTDAEVALILRSAEQQAKAINRWLPILVAFSGARVGEITHLWHEQVKCQDETWFFDIRETRDGGRVKGQGSHRYVPIHPEILAQGFLEFTNSRHGKPLFYEPRQIGAEQSHPAQNLVSRQSEWIRSLGLDHSTKSPNHAFRHWFKTACIRSNISVDVADLIQGHSRDGESKKYRHYTINELFREISKIKKPIFDIIE